MKRKTMNTVVGAAVAASAGIFAYRMMQKRKVEVQEDVDMHNSAEVDQTESVNADVDPAEKGLTQLDAAYREEWQAMGYPQTHREMEKLEEDE